MATGPGPAGWDGGETFALTQHARDVLDERRIPAEWTWWTIRTPDRHETRLDKNSHYLGVIPEHGGRVLHVVVSRRTKPPKIITVFFDRRAGRER